MEEAEALQACCPEVYRYLPERVVGGATTPRKMVFHRVEEVARLETALSPAEEEPRVRSASLFSKPKVEWPKPFIIQRRRRSLPSTWQALVNLFLDLFPDNWRVVRMSSRSRAQVLGQRMLLQMLL
jgi:hypothetical protein